MMNEWRRGALLFSTLGLLMMSTPSIFAGNYLQVSDDLKVYYEELGSGSPIVFVPGWTMSTEFFSHQLRYFSKSYRVINFDPRSQGRSSRTLQNNNYTQHGKDLQAIMQELGLSDVILVGWSYGCLDAYSYVREAGIENLKAFVCIDDTPKPLGINEGDWAEGQATDFKSSYDRMIQDRVTFSKDFAREMVKRTLNPEEHAWIVDQSLKTPADVALLLFLDAMFSDYTAEARMMDGKLPVLNFLHQEEGWTVSGEAWLKENAPGSDIVVLKSHMMFWEQADEFNAALDRFLRAVK